MKSYGGTLPVKYSKGRDVAVSLDEKYCQNDGKRLLHSLENPYYYRVIQDKSKGMYYRINTFGLNFEKSKIKDFLGKKRYLTIFDSKFTIKYILDLNDRNYILE